MTTVSHVVGLILRTLLGLFAIGAVLWWMWGLLRRSEDPARLMFKWIVSVFILGGMLLFVGKMGGLGGGEAAGDFGLAFLIAGSAASCGLFMTFLWGKDFGELIAKPFSALYDGGEGGLEDRPFYSLAEAKRRRKLFPEALAEIHQQLEKCPDDFQGRMLMAEIQAEDLHDLDAAQATIEAIISPPRHAAKNVAFALSRLADWHLKFRHDRDAARQALERIIELLPGTEQAQMAEQRISHLPSVAMMEETVHRSIIALPAYRGKLGIDREAEHATAPVMAPEEMAANYVRHLEEFPLDNEVREKLAQIYADHYRRLDLATNELEQLIAVPSQPAKAVVHWLNLLTDFQIKLSGDIVLARQTLQRIRDLYPKSAAAENALNRIAYLKLSLRGLQQQNTVKLGSYEQNLGLSRARGEGGAASDQ